MLKRGQMVRKTRLQWSLLLAVLFGVCSFSAPHLLGHAHAHHHGAGRISRGPGSSHRSRSGANGADGEHDSDVVASLKAHDPHTPGHVASVAVIAAPGLVPVRWVAVDLVGARDEVFPSLLAGTPFRGRAPPVA